MEKIEITEDGVRVEWEDGDVEEHDLSPGDTFKATQTAESSWVYTVEQGDVDELS